MKTLKNYIDEDFPDDQQDLTELTTVIRNIAKTFQQAYISDLDGKHGWPYVIRSAEPIAVTAPSQSTSSMILISLFRLYGRVGASQIEGWLGTSKESRFKKDLERVALQLLEEVSRNVAGGKYITESSTYGLNDIFTLYWISELHQFASSLPANVSQKSESVSIAIRDYLLSLPETRHVDLIGKHPPGMQLDRFRPVPDHVLPRLRLVQVSALANVARNRTTEHFQFFESQLHQQLSFSSIPDSRFDPAELVFSLEGMLICNADVVNRSVFERVLSVLASIQDSNPYWRPVKPFMALDRGAVLFPVSVEVANSLLRACRLFDRSILHDTMGSRSIALLRRYWGWTRSRSTTIWALKKVSGETRDVPIYGWHSEHINNVSEIHLWETSQVLEFLVGFQEALQNHVARTSLITSRFDFKTNDATDAHSRTVRWNEIRSKFEPVSTLAKEYEIYKTLGDLFVSDSEFRPGSVLLFGPPGTGKSTVAKNLAIGLGCPLITITVSDFLSGGEAEIESRAKDIFFVLERQTNCVVLFDEIDNFLLDRDSKRYAQQQTVFQFMTPGMLTKLADLKQNGKVIFVIATNYAERVDPAIKRTGRIDSQLLVLPPDGPRRAEILGDNKLATDSRFLRVSSLLGYSDLTTARDQQIRKEGAARRNAANGVDHTDGDETEQVKVEDTEALFDTLEHWPRTTKLESYSARLKDEDGQALSREAAPISEFLCLLAMHAVSIDGEAEALKPLHDVIKIARDTLFWPDPATVPDNEIRGVAGELTDESLTALKRALCYGI